ncbi:hypothetical protein PNA2_0916 [Pyrococcus sp. NA2]|uniref:hypothetical protein n=1 Tax=Pyrococcus sp. (strain NA2) TaxID=342949 RepID=UPI000209B05E|nr:hypothetical protein [Pyrococcus sp. NA2]AEC51832.1 hypothetical protein PNA2_0916 [Pyrococcus sp. NA2]
MPVLKLRGVSYPIRFAKEFMKDHKKVEFEDLTRYGADIEINGYKVKLIYSYSNDEIQIWFEDDATIHVLNEIARLSTYLRKAIIFGILKNKYWKIEGHYKIKTPGGEVRISRMFNSLWVGVESSNLIFSATLEGLFELVDVLKSWREHE